MLTERDLERGRADILETMMDTAVIMRSSISTNSSGEGAPGFAAVGTVSARIDPFRSKDTQTYAEREGGVAIFRLTMPYGTELNMGDQIVINTITYETVEVHDSHSDRFVTRAVVAKVSD